MFAKPESVRLDLWLWAARFYKTRSLAKAAVEGGKVRVNAQPCKPAKAMHIGDLVSLVQGNEAMEVRVCVLSEQRASAAIAVTLYAELADSLAKRISQREQTRLQRLGYQAPPSKPDKRDRRRIIQFESLDSSPEDLQDLALENSALEHLALEKPVFPDPFCIAKQILDQANEV